MMTRYGRSPWIDRFPKSRVRSYPRHRGSTPAPVVIVGGGLTGCATAYAFAAAGVKAILLEAGQIGRGNTSAASGWIAEEDRKSTRLNSSHSSISYAVFCLKKKKKER